MYIWPAALGGNCEELKIIDSTPLRLMLKRAGLFLDYHFWNI